jgi:endonuclease/exonuclease/phosphatase family metal-dependent hydrolase
LALALIRWVGAEWWGVLVLLFMPRWLWLLPVVPLAVASGVRRCPWHWVLQGATALVVAGPLMGASLPVHRLWEGTPEGERLRVATLNVSPYPIRVHALMSWVDRAGIDVLCLQEVDSQEDHPIVKAFREAGWYVAGRRHVVSRFPIEEELPRLPDDSTSRRRYSATLDRVRLKTRGGAGVIVACVHLPTIREGIVDLFHSKTSETLEDHVSWWAHEVSRVLAALAEAAGPPLVVAGDFNMPSDDATMAALRSDFQFAFESAGWGYGYTRPARLPWVRIDHVLASHEWAVTGCRVGPHVGSDHLPMVAELVLPRQAEAAGR